VVIGNASASRRDKLTISLAWSMPTRHCVDLIGQVDVERVSLWVVVKRYGLDSSSLGQMKLSGYRQLKRLPLGDTGREKEDFEIL
jgi:hypothetical protein